MRLQVCRVVMCVLCIPGVGAAQNGVSGTPLWGTARMPQSSLSGGINSVS
jgi:hypothetical protein